MKILRNVALIVIAVLCAVAESKAQTADVLVVVKGIKEAKGKIMVAASGKAISDKMIGDMKKVSNADSVVCVLKNVPIGKVSLNAFQDLNENFQLDKDENNIPIEPCCTKNGVIIKEGENRIELKLINVKEMMGGN